jgi:hypothetical protein
LKKKHEKDKKATIKRINIRFNMKTKQNQMESDKIRKNLKKNSKQRKTTKKERIIIEFFSPLFVY